MTLSLLSTKRFFSMELELKLKLSDMSCLLGIELMTSDIELSFLSHKITSFPLLPIIVLIPFFTLFLISFSLFISSFFSFFISSSFSRNLSLSLSISLSFSFPSSFSSSFSFSFTLSLSLSFSFSSSFSSYRVEEFNLFKHIQAAENAECDPPTITILCLPVVEILFFNLLYTSSIPSSVQTKSLQKKKEMMMNKRMCISV